MTGFGFGFDYTFGVRPFESGIHGRVSGSGADAMNVQRACVILFWLGEVFRDKKEQKKKTDEGSSRQSSLLCCRLGICLIVLGLDLE